MTLRRLPAPAPYHTLVAMLCDRNNVSAYNKLASPETFAKLQILAKDARSWGFARERDKATLACAGFVPLGVDGDGRPHYEAWFACWPQLAPHMRSFLRLAQLTLAELPQDAIVEARVAPGWRPGEKLASLLGFRRGSRLGQSDLWEWRHP
jgi:hypothetical protein